MPIVAQMVKKYTVTFTSILLNRKNNSLSSLSKRDARMAACSQTNLEMSKEQLTMLLFTNYTIKTTVHVQ